MDGDIQDCIDHLIVAENCRATERKRIVVMKGLSVEKAFHTVTEAFQNCLKGASRLR